MKKVFIALDVLSVIISIASIFHILSKRSNKKAASNIQEG